MNEDWSSDRASTDEEVLRIGQFTLDRRRRGLYRSSERIHLTPKPFEVLNYLVLRKGHVVSKTEILNAVWQGHQDENVVEQAVRQIRRALNEDKTSPRFIQTLSGQGYCYIGEADRERPIPVAPDTPDSPPAHIQTLLTFVIKHRRLGAATLASLILVIVIVFRPRLPDPRLVNPVRITRSQNRILSPILTDGARLYYQRFANGRYTIAEVAANGGDTLDPALGVSNPELCDIAPEGGSLLVRDLVHSREDSAPVYVQPLVGGPVHRIGDILAYDVAWYPDGQHILYTIAGGVYLTDLEGRSRRWLFAVPGNAYWFRWSPNGNRLRFTVVDPKTEATSLWEASSTAGTGNDPHPLFADWKGHAQQCCGNWTPDGDYFVFQVRTDNTFHIWAKCERISLLHSVNDKPVPLTAGPINYRGPVLSKDGKKLFVRTEVPKGEIVRFERLSGQYIPLLPGTSARTAAFSRDGHWIAYSSLPDNNLWRCRATGTDCLQLTRGLQQAVMPRWSPDGTNIAFMGRYFAKGWGIYAVSADGANLRSLCSGNLTEGDPDWSPDGTTLVFGNVMEPADSMAIYLLDLHNRHIATLPGSSGHLSPRWSSDGHFIVAMRADDHALDIFDTASQKWTNLTKISGGYPNWSHDSKQVYFFSVVRGQRVVLRVRVSDRRVEQVASLASVEQGPFIMGTWIGLTPDDSPLAVRNLTTEDIYAWDFEAR